MVLVDLPGYGLSAKPDVGYALTLQADVVVALAAALGLRRLALLTHDMGDSVGGELLARQCEGTWPVEVTRRVVTNGSIYLAMANLTEGQQLLLSLPDERLTGALAPPSDAPAGALAATLSPANRAMGMGAHAEPVAHGGGNRPRTPGWPPYAPPRADGRTARGAPTSPHPPHRPPA